MIVEWLANASLNSVVQGSDKNPWGEKDPFAIFDALLQRQSGMETLSNQFLQTGIDHYQNKNYEEAVKSFKASIGISPNSPYNPDTSKYLAQTYLKLEETQKAFDIYRQAIVRNPDRDDLRT
ncbi:MAG: outer membrane protein assembly factor BamD, partial [Desulfosarcina sp.]